MVFLGRRTVFLASPLYLPLKAGKSRKEVSPKDTPCAEPCPQRFL